MVEIRWYGQTCFHLNGQRAISVVTDPFPPQLGIPLPGLEADVVTVSHHGSACDYVDGIRGPFRLIDGPGEYEISGVFITGVSTYADDQQGRIRGLNTLFAFDFGGPTICHLGRLGHVPTQSQIKNLGSVDILLVPVGGGGSLSSSQASEVVRLFEPGLVVPMRYEIAGLQEDLDRVDSFLKEMGRQTADRHEVLQVGESGLSGETEIFVLEARGE